MQDVKAAEPALSDLIKRIEALESKPGGGGNVSAPKIRGLKMGFDIRHRFEFRSDGAGNGGNNAIDSEFTLQRVRLSLDADVNRNVRGFVKLQDVRTFGAEQSTTGNLSRVDLLEGFVELRNLGDFTSLLNNTSLRVGRWQQWYGKNRWFGHLNWANQSRSYDGIKFRYDNKKNVWVDLWAYQISEDQTGVASGDNTFGATGTTGRALLANGTVPVVGATATNNGPYRSVRDELFWGMYAGVKVLEGLTVEPYIAIRNRSRDADGDRSPDFATLPPGASTAIGGEQRYHVGGRLVGKNIHWLPGVDFTFEQAWQFGRTEAVTYRSQDIDAYGGAYDIGYTFKDIPWSPRIGYSYVFASGDDDPTDGDNETFSHLYPTGHATMGYIDFHAWQNIRDHQGHLSFQPTKKMLVKVDYHNFSAADRLDDWYTVGGAGRGVGGSSVSDNYGDEIDVTVKYKLLKNFGVVAGYSKYMAGKFVEDARGGDRGDTDWFYLQTTMKF
ncbi:hypothetical protein SCALIN_C11_0067 [Candidatus Scalindua japonica]|uniref:Alginate export domain-containing protein n=2 Tax=Candidatus Scalindua japonica TaxID=1284222 RepID=A0A286TX51_9BACT|nr:hypothetical protein SCALIN_C11_0067 [Candidatus Scalindua japonica]